MNPDEGVADDDEVRVVALGRDHELVVRRLRAGDRPALEALFAQLPADDIRLRFFTVSRPGKELLDHWFIADEDRVGRFVALEDGVLVADAGWYRLPDGDAELDITVESHHRGWLGPYLLDAVVADARRHGIRNLVAEIERSNAEMLALVRERGVVSLGDEDAAFVRVAIGAAHAVPLWHDREPGRPRLLLEGHAMPWRADEYARTYGADLVACHIATRHGPNRCPALAGQPCPLADGADAVVVTVPSTDKLAHRLLSAHERLHPGTARFVMSGRSSCPPPGVASVDRVDLEGVEAVLHELGVPVQLVRRSTGTPQ